MEQWIASFQGQATQGQATQGQAKVPQDPPVKLGCQRAGTRCQESRPVGANHQQPPANDHPSLIKHQE